MNITNAAFDELIARNVFAIVSDELGGCFQDSDLVGAVVEHGGRQYLVVDTPDGQRRRWVRDGVTSRCLTVWEGRRVIARNAVEIESIPELAGQWASCDTELKTGDIVRVGATGAAYVVDRSGGGAGVARPIAESETYRCLVARGACVDDGLSPQHIEALAVVEPVPVCVDVAAFVGRVITGPGGRTELIAVGGTGRHIPSGGTFRCLTTWAGHQQVGEIWTQAQLDAVPHGPPASCDADLVCGGEVVREPSGHADRRRRRGSGAQHPDRARVSMPRGERRVGARGPEPRLAAGVRVRRGPTRMQRILAATDLPHSYFQDRSGILHWLRNTSSYWCAVDRGYPVVRTRTQTQLDALPEATAYEDCLSGSRYHNTMIRRSDGTVWVVDDLGRRRHVPDGHSYSCYEARGYRLVESNLTAEQAASLPEVGRMGYCLNPSSFRNVMIRLSDGTVYKTDGNACRLHVGNGWTFERLREWGVPLVADGLNGEHAGSLPSCGTHPWLFSVTSFRNTLIRQSNGTVFLTDGNGCRRHVRDTYTLERLQEIGYAFKHTSAAQSEIDSLPSCGAHPLALAQWRVRNRVVRATDGTAYFVTNDNLWHWIPDGSTYNHLVSRYGLAGTFSWEAINSIGARADGLASGDPRGRGNRRGCQAPPPGRGSAPAVDHGVCACQGQDIAATTRDRATTRSRAAAATRPARGVTCTSTDRDRTQAGRDHQHGRSRPVESERDRPLLPAIDRPAAPGPRPSCDSGRLIVVLTRANLGPVRVLQSPERGFDSRRRLQLPSGSREAAADRK